MPEDNDPVSFPHAKNILLYVTGEHTNDPLAPDEALPSAREHLTNWHRRARDVQLSCYNSATWFDFWHFMIGAPLIVLTSAAATSYYKALVTQHRTFLGVPTEILGLLLPILAALQTFLKYGQRAEKFRTTAAKYGSIRREMEQGSSLLFGNKQEAEKLMNSLRKELDTLAREAPEAPSIVWEWTQLILGLKKGKGSPLFPNTSVP